MRALPRRSGFSTAAASKPATPPNCSRQPNIDGALVGGASLKADDFLGIGPPRAATESVWADDGPRRRACDRRQNVGRRTSDRTDTFRDAIDP